jgi:triosephosphate isomerase
MSSSGRRPFVVGNWKMQLPVSAAAETARAIARALPPLPDRDVAVAPSFPALLPVAEALRGSPVQLVAQDLFWKDDGPFTGEVSGPMLVETGARAVLVGHSERRQHLGETDAMVGLKTWAALRAGLVPIVCVGEQQDDRDGQRHERIVRDMLLRSLESLPQGAAETLVVGYEPVWAIGTGCSATAADASEMHACLREGLQTLFGQTATRIRIVYGGSVTEQNIDELMAQPDVDGVLVGGASLRAESFVRIAAFGAPSR